MRLAASMQIPSLVAAASTASTASDAVHPVLQLWHDGQRAAVGNARHQAVWIVDLVGGSTSLELSGALVVDTSVGGRAVEEARGVGAVVVGL